MINYPGAFFQKNISLGNGVDGSIIVNSGVVDIQMIYENDVVFGVTTERGVNRGLNHGIGSYNPETNKDTEGSLNVISCINFTIESSATLTCSGYSGSDETKGIIWVSCLGDFINEGAIDVNGKGWSGAGARSVSGVQSTPGVKGGGLGIGANYFSGGPTYNSTLSMSTFTDIFGSGGNSGDIFIGGGGGSISHDAAGNGGGAVRIYTRNFTNTGTITSNGSDGGDGTITIPISSDMAAPGMGGGSGGSIYIRYIDLIDDSGSTSVTGGTGGSADVIGAGATNTGGGAGFGTTGQAGIYNTAGGYGGSGRTSISTF